MTEPPFARLAASPSAALADLLLALSAEFGPVDRRETRGGLDNQARALSGLLEEDRLTQAERLLEAMEGRLALRTTMEDEPAAFLLDQVLKRRQGHPALVAAVGSELAQRAGVPAAVYSTRTRWFVGLGSPQRLILLDVAGHAGCSGPWAQVRRVWPHELALAALTGLTRSFTSQQRRDHARHAAQLRLMLPSGLRPAVSGEIERFHEPRHHGAR
jgi:hypothetical protein